MDDKKADLWSGFLEARRLPERLQKCGYDFSKIKEKLLWFKENAQDYPLEKEDREKLTIPFFELVIVLEPIVSGEPDVKKVGRLVEEFLKGLDEVRVRAEKWLARQKALKGPCAPVAKKLGEKRQEFKEKQAAFQKIQGLFNILNRAAGGGILPVRILIAKGSIYDYTRADRTREKRDIVQRRLDEHLTAAKDILNSNGINVGFEYIEPVIVDEGKLLRLGDLRRIGVKYGGPCMPILIFTDEIEPPPGEPPAYSGLADPQNDVAGITSNQYAQMSAGRHIAHNIAHILGIPDNKGGHDLVQRGELILEHIGKHAHPGTYAAPGEKRKMLVDFKQRLNACKKNKDALDKELEKKRNELDELRKEIARLDKELEDCLKKGNRPREELRDVEKVWERCEALRYGWPELRRRYDDLGRQVHLANDELDKAKEMLEEIRRLLLLMDECVQECEKSARKPDEGIRPPDGGEAKPRSGEPSGAAPDSEGGLARKRITVNEPAGPPQPEGDGLLEPFERLWKLVKKIFQVEPNEPSTTSPAGGTKRAARLEDELPRPTESETGGEAGGGETSTSTQPPAGTEGVTGEEETSTSTQPPAGTEAVTGAGETSTAAQTLEPVKKTIKLDAKQIRPPEAGSGVQGGEAGGRVSEGIHSGRPRVKRISRPNWRTFGGEISIPGLGSVGVIPLVITVFVGGTLLLSGGIYGGYRLIKAIGEAAASRPVEVEEPGIVAPPESVSPAPPVEEPVIRLATLSCHIDNHLGYVDLNGPPGYYWRIYFSTNEPVPGAGDAFSEGVRLDIENAQYWDFEDHSYGYFDESGSALFSFPLQLQIGQTRLWMQAVVVENPDILISNPTPGQVILTEVCHIAY